MLTDIISKDGINILLPVHMQNRTDIMVLEKTESTNILLKEKAFDGAEEGTVIIAGEQTAGIGRMGRSFFSPGNTGLYMSLLLKPHIKPEESVFITTAAAVAVCKALEKNGVGKTGIKWVNDIYIDGKKVCGILTQGNIDSVKKELNFAVLGIGINIYEPQGGFPSEIKKIAGAAFSFEKENLRNRIVADFLEAFFEIYSNFKDKSYIDEYVKRSIVIGRRVDVITSNDVKNATVMGIENNCKLHVVYDNGVEDFLDSGEISLKLV